MLIALDDDKIILSNFENNANSTQAILNETETSNEDSRNLHILGWNNAAPIILDDLIGYLPENSIISISSRSNEAEKYLDQLNLKKDITFKYHKGDIRNKDFLESINIASATNVLILSSSFYEDHESADAATLFSLINLREIRKENDSNFTILSEVLNSNNSELISVEKSDDFVMSERIINLMLAQLSENPGLDAFFKELMQPDGSEIYFRPVTKYIDISNEVTFKEISTIALNNGESAIGFRLNDQVKDKSHNYGIYLNPNKLDRIRFKTDDQIIVFSLS